MLRTAFVLFALAMALSSCSSKPKTPEVIYETRNKALEFQKLADSFYSRGQFEQALSLYDESIKTASSVDYYEGIASARASVGRVYLAVGRLEEAERELLRAYDYARALGSPVPASLAASGLGEVLFKRGKAEEALARFDEAAALAGSDEGAKAVAWHNSATAKAGLGRLAEARNDLERASDLNARNKRWAEFAANRYLLASILSKEGRSEEAYKVALEALESDKKAENGRGVAADLSALARISQKLGRLEESYWYWRRSYDTALAVNDLPAVDRALAALEQLAPGLGRKGSEPDWAGLRKKLEAIGP